MASDLGILLHTVVIAWLLNYRRLVRLERICHGARLRKALAMAVVAGLACYAVAERLCGRQLAAGSDVAVGDRCDVAGRGCGGIMAHAVEVVERVAAKEEARRRWRNRWRSWRGPRAAWNRKRELRLIRGAVHRETSGLRLGTALPTLSSAAAEQGRKRGALLFEMLRPAER